MRELREFAKRWHMWDYAREFQLFERTENGQSHTWQLSVPRDVERQAGESCQAI
jgi:hypothetical protein